MKKRKSGLSIFKKSVLLVTMPRESIENDQEKASSLQSIQEKIGIMEAIYSNISGLSKSMNFKSLFSGPKNHLTFEIVVKNGIISFYIAAPKNLKQFIIQQVQAQYPNAHIEETEDYNIFSPQGFIDGVYLKLEKSSIFPIKTYKSLQSDPLNALINALSKMESDDGATLQFVVRPAQNDWRLSGSKIVSEVRKGKSLKSAINQIGDSKSSVLTSLGGDIGKSILGSSVFGENKPAVQEAHKMSPLEEESVKKIEEKISRSGLEVNIRIIVSADKKDQVETYLDNIVNSFGQYNIYEYGNSFKSVTVFRQKTIINDFIYRNFNQSKKMVLNSEEMASLFHFPLVSSQTPNIQWLSSKEAPAPNNIPETGIVLGENIYREVKSLIRINRSDRTRHIYAVGKSGTGKSEFLSNMAKQDILNGDGVAVIDPHGDLVNDILDTIPNERIKDVIYFDPADVERPMGINLLEYNKKYPEQKTFVINEMISIFDKLYDLKQTGGPMFEQYMRNAMLLVMEDPKSGSTLMEISKVLADADFRKYKLSKCLNPVVKDFWQKEAEKAGGDAALANMVPYITSKLNTFISNDIMRPIIGQQKSAFDLRTIMDERKILLVNLSKGKIGEMNSYLLGMMLVGKILMSALSRTDISRNERKDFYLYLDEFQNFITESITIILSEARKYRLNLNIAHQYIGQLSHKQDTSIRDAIFGNIGTIVSFKVGAEDAEFLAKEFAPVFSAYDLINIDKFNAYVKLIIDNQPARAFNMKTFPLQKNKISNADRIKQFSRLKYGNDRSIVEAEILKRAKM
ncbi:MAG: type IV secretion system DNA-binding domain-containing protein [Xanthomonadaceae bacterium]|nr:type IV secretion system DNA-binding domain-containing protein [Rhodospirillaceae bacterium]NIA17682.1 type IV secretion system DNA-binding domain-containing protein [Xanthomonadaceae bacterium]